MENQENILAAEALDAIGEIMNISMGSAATAVSNMLDKQVTITTPKLEQQQFKDIDSSELEPAVIVQIRYVEGIEGVNVIMLKKKDMQIILNLLMGNEFSDDAEADANAEDFVFDELSMSAACEVMNQMMGASATALSEILGMPINISTPEAREARTKDEINVAFNSIGQDEQVVAISFHMRIKDALDTTFCCFLNTSLATKIVEQVSSTMEEPVPAPPQAAPTLQPSAEPQLQQPQMQQPQMQQMQQPQMQQPQMQQPQMQQMQQPQPQPLGETQPYVAPDFAREPMQFATQPKPFPEQPQMPTGYPGYPPQGMPPYGQNPYAQQPGYPPQQQPYGYPPPQQWMQQQGGHGGYVAPPQNVKSAEFPDFSRQGGGAIAPCGSNMGLLLNVQLDVSVIIGRTRRKIRDIVDFGQGTVVELDKQTGAPAEIMVNGQLLAYGEVIVVGDNFGVRVTEIVGTKELLESLDSNT